ncbi:MAG TPA: hypothetical protein VGB13_13405 [Candidatus Krumholzibacteria bacterium]
MADATEAWLLEVSVDGHGFAPSPDHRAFPSESAAEAARALRGGGISRTRIRRYCPVDTTPAGAPADRISQAYAELDKLCKRLGVECNNAGEFELPKNPP